MNKKIKNKILYFIKSKEKAPQNIRRGILILLILFFIFKMLDFVFPLSLDFEYSTIVVSQDKEVLHAFLTTDEKWRMKTELDEIIPQLKKAIVYKEDKFFYYHFGINPIAIIRAIFNNLLQQKRTSGASTITMQVARLLEPKERSYVNKSIEMFRALQLEWHFSKDEILQLYLNLVPYGGNIEGVKAASILYFDKAPNHLSIAELTALSIIPNRPNSLKIGANNKEIEKARNKWLNRFKDEGLFDGTDIDDAIDEPLKAFRHEAPKLAPHFSYRIKKHTPGIAIIKTTLCLQMQKQIELMVSNYIKQQYHRNIKNASVLIVNNQTHEVKTYIGSANFYNNDDAGQVDGVTAIRSPGSTLKPLVYGMAIDMGFITSKTNLNDVHVNYAGYEPENYNGDFNGKVTVEFALSNSLNITAVKVLNLIKTHRFVSRLKAAKFQQIKKDEKKLGLSVVLGGCGVSLEELTRMYCAFANYGEFKELKYLQKNHYKTSINDNIDTQNATINKFDTTTVKLLSPSATFMITEILTKVMRPDLPTYWFNSPHLPKVAWKTGTSYGRRDAWSIGYNKKYTVGVWVGNFSAEGVPGLSGSNTAAPLLFNIFNAIDKDSPDEWYSPPDKIDFRLVCSESGLLPGKNCKNLVMDYYLPTISSNEKCNHLSEVWISPDSLISYCIDCLPETGYIKALYNNYSPEIINYYEQKQIQYNKIPPHNPECERIFAKNSPQITSPVSGLEYYIDKADSTEMMLTCNVAINVEKIYWYINNKFYKPSKATEKLFFQPPEGKVKISCTDDKGRNTDIWIEVKHIEF